MFVPVLTPPATDENFRMLHILMGLDFELGVFEGWGMALPLFAVHTAWRNKSHTADTACGTNTDRNSGLRPEGPVTLMS